MEAVNMREKIEHEQTHYMKKQDLATLQETIQSTSSSPPPPTTASPPSATASPTHEFSFTISLHPQKTRQYGHNYSNNDTYNYDTHHTTTTTTTPSSEPLTAIDLSPADDIFFHGHLLPLHLLSHLPISPRSSTNSMDSFTLPMKDILKDQHNPIGNTSFHYHQRNTFSDFNLPNKNASHTRPKSKSFSIFGRPKWKKGSFHDEKELDHEDQDKERNYKNDNSKKKQLKLEVAQLIKRYMKMVRPLLSFQKTKRSNITEFNRQQPHSFSGNLLSSRSSLAVTRGEFSAPASMRTSPANSGVLLASGTATPAKSTSDSTMEELHAAIQAAIAHCKNSISMEDKIQT